MIVRVIVVLNKTVADSDSDSGCRRLCVSDLRSQRELYHVSEWYLALVTDLIGQLSRDVIGRLTVKP